MPSESERLETAVAKVEADADILHNIVHGTAGESPITTEGGPVKTAAKVIEELGDSGNYAKRNLSNVPDGSVNLAMLAAQAVNLSKLASDVLSVLQNSGLDPTKYQGTWDASTDTPTIAAAAGGNAQFWYFVNVAGTATGNAAGTYSYGDVIVSNGTTWLRRPAPPTVIPDASITYDKLSDELKNASRRNGSTDIAYAIVDVNNRMAFGIRANGELVGKFVPPDGSITYEKLAEELVPALPVPLSEGTGFVYAIVDVNNRMAFGIRTNGDVVARFTLGTNSVGTAAVIDKAITRIKLEDQLARTSLNNPLDVVQVTPDPWRFTQGEIALRTEPGGYTWAPLPRVLTPVVRGVNSSGTTLQLRKRSGLMVRGRRYGGTFDPGAVASTTYKGTVSDTSTWPPSGVFVSGDYYAYNASVPRVIGSDTVNRGDLLVNNGSAWVVQFGPTTVSGELDWWAVSANGTYDGLVLTAGDRLVYLGFESTSGTGLRRWIKGNPLRGEFFVRGELDPASGLPASPVDGDVWQITASGSAGGFSFVEHDLLVRDLGAWGHVPSEPVKSCANGAHVHLPCAVSADEWELRRADKSTTRVNVSLRSYRQANVRRHRDEVFVTGDSMTAFLSGVLSGVFAPRTITAKGYGAGTSTNILSMLQREITSLGDPYKARVHGLWTGQNNDNHSAKEIALRAAELFGARDSRFFFMSVLGTRNATFNGTRIVIGDQENQFNAVAGSRYDLVKFYQDTFPENFFDTRAQLCAVAGSTPDLQFPGMTEAQVAATYGITPLSWFMNYAGNSITPGSLNFVGYRSSAGLPTGGSANDYYVRSANGTVGALIINVGGVWTEYTFDTVHLFSANGSPGNVALATALLGFLNTKGW